MGIVNLEAMAAGKAVVASNTGGVPEIVIDGQTGVLVTPESPDDLAIAISSLLADPDRAARLGAAGRRRVTQFTWSAAAAKYSDIYQKSLAARTSGGVAEFATA
jgi:starch synthase